MTTTSATAPASGVGALAQPEPRLQHDRWGLPLWSAPLEGPVTGALMFRVGSGDEPLPRRGFTHLVEHMALSGFHDPTLQWNGFVDLNRTVFHATGPQANVERFLMHVAARLSHLDPATLRRECDVLAAEARTMAPSLVGELLSRRYGARQWGTSAWWEMAIPGARPEAVEEWQQRWFTRENAVVWMSAHPTQELRIDLPNGSRMVPPADPPDLVTGRGWVHHNGGQLVLLARGERSYASAMACGAILSEVHRVVRERGLGYAVQGAWHRLTATRGAMSMVADVAERRELEHVQVVLDVLDELAVAVPERIFHDRRAAMAQADPADVTRQRLDAWALDLLLGMRRGSVAEETAAELAVTPDEAAAACRVLRDDMLLGLPERVAPPAGRCPRVEPTNDRPVAGRWHGAQVFYRRDDAKFGLHVGEQGVSSASVHRTVTVRWDQAAVVMRWHDGTRLAVDHRGEGVLVEPSRYQRGREAAAAFDAHVDEARSVTVGSRYGPPVLPAASAAWVKVLTIARGSGVALLALIGAVGLVTRSIPGAVVAVVALAAAAAFTAVSTRRPVPFIWDDSNTWADVPAHHDRSAWYVPTGLLLGWAIDRGHLHPDWAAAHHRELAEYAEGRVTAPQLYRATGGILADDVVDTLTNDFFTDYLAQRTSGYDVDLARNFPTCPDYFSIPDTALSQQVVTSDVERAFTEWARIGRRGVTRHLHRIMPGNWGGPQSKAWAATVVQWARRRRWT